MKRYCLFLAKKHDAVYGWNNLKLLSDDLHQVTEHLECLDFGNGYNTDNLSSIVYPEYDIIQIIDLLENRPLLLSKLSIEYTKNVCYVVGDPSLLPRELINNWNVVVTENL
jgi:hypothetical protein